MPSRASAPTGSRAWLLIEHEGLWAEQAAATPLPGHLGELAVAADALGIRVQLIRRPSGRTANGDADSNGNANGNGDSNGHAAGSVFAGWTVGPDPWLADVTGAVHAAESGDGLDLSALAAGERPASGIPVDRMYLVCVHGRRNRCCARFGGPLARSLADGYASDLWETTHLGGHKFAANMVLLPHGLYYGPCDTETATAAIEAYRRGGVVAHRFRGRAGQDVATQEAEYTAIEAAGQVNLAL